MNELDQQQQPVAQVRETTETVATGDQDDARIFKDILSFQRGFGMRSKTISAYVGKKMMPALMFPYRELEKIRHDYPLCINDNPASEALLPLRKVVDQLIVNVGDNSDAQKRIQLYLTKVEVLLKELIAQKKRGSLEDLWQQAAEKLFGSLDMQDQKNVELQQQLPSPKTIGISGEVIAYDARTPIHVLHGTWKSLLHQQNMRYDDSLNALIVKLEDVLAADLAKADDSYTAERLQATSGVTDDVDFAKLAQILPGKIREGRLSDERRLRIENVLTKLKQLRALYTVSTATNEVAEQNDFWCNEGVHSPEHDFAHSLTKLRTRMDALLDYMKAMQIAFLEVADKYQAQKHDAFFENFSWKHVNKDALALCPPLIVLLETTKLQRGDQSALFEALTWKIPIKIMLLASDLQAASWLNRIGELALCLQDVFVVQGACCNIDNITSALEQALNYPGPALLHLHSENSGKQAVSSYIATAAAQESRAFPQFTYNPAHGTTWAQRFTITQTPGYEKDWPVSLFSYMDTQEKEVTVELPFTYADYLVGDTRFAEQFLSVPQNLWKSKMVPLHDYLELAGKDIQDLVPYILVVDDNMQLHRAVVTQDVVSKTLKCRDAWRRLQELGGINNSHAMNMLTTEKAKLAETAQQQVEEIERQHTEKLEQSIGKVAEAVVDKIAAGLLGLTQASTVATPVAQVAPKTTSTAATTTAETQPAEVEEEEEALSFDEPYIDTPRCTSCNECIGINKQMFVYDDNKQAIIADATAGTFRQLVEAAEKCPAKIIHPGKPLNPNEEGLEDLIKRAAPFN